MSEIDENNWVRISKVELTLLTMGRKSFLGAETVDEIASLFDGAERTTGNKSYDFHVVRGGRQLKFEVKKSSLRRIDSRKRNPSRRWVWTNLLGNSGCKDYDYLILVGELDEVLQKFFKTADSNAFYILPRAEVSQILKEGNVIGRTLSFNPVPPGGRIRALLTREYHRHLSSRRKTAADMVDLINQLPESLASRKPRLIRAAPSAEPLA